MIKGGQKTLPLKIALPCPAAGRKAFRLAFAVLTLVLVGISLAACGNDSSPPPERRLPATIAVPKASPTTPPGDPILVGAGDIGSCSSDRDTQTGALLDAIFAAGNQGYVFAAGDVAYNDGTDAEFAQCYDPAWGQHKSRTRPAPGNHDYFTEGAAGYFAYFGEAAGNPQEGYYSFDLGGWHIVVLNTNNDCEVVSCEAGSPQEQWLRADLAAHPAGCTLAVWHEARFSSGGHGSNEFTSSLWQALYDFGAEIVVRSAPDGHTLLVGSTSEIGIGPSLYTKLPYDVLRDLVPVAPLAATPMVLVVHPSMPVRTAKDLVALARARPGQINYGSAGAGSGAHMAAELFRYLTKADIVHVPYKGVAPAMADVIGGQVQVLFTTLPSATAFIKAGRLKALGVASPQRASSMPELATMAESGVPGYEMEYWYGFFAPAATPKDILARIHADTTEVLRQPDVVANLGKQGVHPVIKTQAQFAAFVRADIENWAVVVKASGTKVD